MNKTIARFLLCLAVLLSAAACSRRDLVRENVENAKLQLGALIADSQQGDTLRLPSDFYKGAIHYCRPESWVSGFFAGSLWYMYALTGEETWAEQARRYTEALHDVQYLTWHHDIGFMIGDSYGY